MGPGAHLRESKLQKSEIPLRAFEPGWAVIEPGGEPRRSLIQLQLNATHLALFYLSPAEAYTIGSSLVEHALECGYDPEEGE